MNEPAARGTRHRWRYHTIGSRTNASSTDAVVIIPSDDNLCRGHCGYVCQQITRDFRLLLCLVNMLNGGGRWLTLLRRHTCVPRCWTRLLTAALNTGQSSPPRAGLDDVEKVQQDNDPNWYSKQPKCNSSDHFLLSAS